MKLPQGVGQVYKLSGARRKSYIVRKTVGFIESKEKKKQIIKTIGYARTYQDGFLMLMNYNSEVAKNPNQSSMVLHQYNEDKEYFLYDGAYKYNYGQIRFLFDNFKKKSNMNHTIHETRHTYTSRLRLRGVNSTFTKKLTGHRAGNVDEDVYTHIGIGDLYKIVNDAFKEDMKYVG